jgi:hypothetical protein
VCTRRGNRTCHLGMDFDDIVELGGTLILGLGRKRHSRVMDLEIQLVNLN